MTGGGPAIDFRPFLADTRWANRPIEAREAEHWGGRVRLHLAGGDEGGPVVARLRNLPGPDPLGRLADAVRPYAGIPDHPVLARVLRADGRRVETEPDFALHVVRVVEEEVEGTPLAELPVTGPVRLCERVRAVARAAGHLHERGLRHGAIRPSRILCTGSEARLVGAGWGLVSALRLGSSPDRDRFVRPRDITDGNHGTCYLAPEQLEPVPVAGGEDPPPGAPADVFALGTILYERLALRNPFYCESAEPVGGPEGPIWFDTADCIRFRAFRTVPLRDLLAERLHPLVEVIEQCHRQDPAARPPDGQALDRLLAEATADLDGEVSPGDGHAIRWPASPEYVKTPEGTRQENPTAGSPDPLEPEIDPREPEAPG